MAPKNAFKSIIGLISVLIIIATLGCSRSVTSKTVILTARVTITFDGPVDLDQINYLLIVSQSSNLTLPPNSAPYLYFPTPGRSFNDQYFLSNYGSIGDFYSQYYSTWSDYLIIGRNLRAAYKSGSTQFTAPTTTVDGETQIATSNFTFPPTSGFTPVASVNGNQLTITFQIDQLTSASQFYLQVATVAKNVNSDMVGYDAGEFRDKLSSPILVLVQQSNAPQTIPETDNSDQKGTDILSCTVQVL